MKVDAFSYGETHLRKQEDLEFVRYLLRVGGLSVPPEKVRGVVYVKGVYEHPASRVRGALERLLGKDWERVYREALSLPLEKGWNRFVVVVVGEREMVESYVIDEPPQGLQAL